MNPYLAAKYLLAETLRLDLDPFEDADGDFEWRLMMDAHGFAGSEKAIIRLAEDLWCGAVAEAASSLDDTRWLAYQEALVILRERPDQTRRDNR
jgi:hypothetical protein